MKTPFFEMKDLSYVYEDGTNALKNIHLRIERGKKIALLGSNGAGKSTLFLHFNGLLKPSSGMIYFNGQPLTYSKKELVNLRRSVGIVFQNPETQLFNGTVREDIAYGPYNLNLSEKEREACIEKAITQTEVEQLLEKPIHFLSVGQKKRVSIAGVLAMDPEVILLDEPTASLDYYYTMKIYDLLNELHAEGRTIILSTHNIDFAYEWADEVVVMHEGQVIYQGDISRLFEQQKTIVDIANIETPIVFEMGHLLKNQGIISDLRKYRSKEKTMQVIQKCFMQETITK